MQILANSLGNNMQVQVEEKITHQRAVRSVEA